VTSQAFWDTVKIPYMAGLKPKRTELRCDVGWERYPSSDWRFPETRSHDISGTAVDGTVYDTAAKVAAAVFSSPSTLGVASGATFADALSGGAFEGLMGGPMLLTDPSALPDSTKNYLGVVSWSLNSSTLFGGTSAVNQTVQQALNTALGG